MKTGVLSVQGSASSRETHVCSRHGTPLLDPSRELSFNGRLMYLEAEISALNRCIILYSVSVRRWGRGVEMSLAVCPAY
jgi:hypothetical protein